jgi:hypothetical protein
MSTGFSIKESVKRAYREKSGLLVILSGGRASIYVEGEDVESGEYENQYDALDEVLDAVDELELDNVVKQVPEGFIIFAWKEDEGITIRKREEWLGWVKEKLKKNGIRLTGVFANALVGLNTVILPPPTPAIRRSIKLSTAYGQPFPEREEATCSIVGSYEFLRKIGLEGKMLDELSSLDVKSVTLYEKVGALRLDVDLDKERILLVTPDPNLIDYLVRFAIEIRSRKADFEDVYIKLIKSVSERILASTTLPNEIIKELLETFIKFSSSSLIKKYVLEQNSDKDWAMKILAEAPSGLDISTLPDDALSLTLAIIHNLWRFGNMIPENLTARIGQRRMDRIRSIYQSVYNYILSPENKDYFNEASEMVYTLLSSLLDITRIRLATQTETLV